MMHRIRIPVAALLASLTNPAFSQSIYFDDFNYNKIESSFKYFSEKSPDSIAKFCKSLPHASQEDMDQCGHRDFELADHELTNEFGKFISKSEKNDLNLKKDSEPISLPYFMKSEETWLAYRDNYCYGETYGLGQASMRYQVFWSCMTRMTKNRLAELKNPKDW